MKAQRMRQLRRTLTVLQILSDGAFHGLEDLARLCGCCTRTVRRDVDALDEVGFPIDVDHFAVQNPAPRTYYRLVNARVARVLMAGRFPSQEISSWLKDADASPRGSTATAMACQPSSR